MVKTDLADGPGCLHAYIPFRQICSKVPGAQFQDVVYARQGECKLAPPSPVERRAIIIRKNCPTLSSALLPEGDLGRK